ncbi:MAG: hypothetical protein M1820_001639 [Bogoriella megaspora]|nr:MAG: hypothetical protein M1820_001639 [Bogoriella megaspora]
MGPYMCLVHYYDEFKGPTQPCETKQGYEGCRKHSHASLCEDQTKNDVPVLLDILEPTMEDHIRPALRKLARSTPVVNFDTAWLLLRPGIDAYTYLDLRRKFSVSQVISQVVLQYPRRGPDSNSPQRGPDANLPPPTPQGLHLMPKNRKSTCHWDVLGWMLTSDGERIGRLLFGTKIYYFEGEKEVSQLLIFPCEYEHRHNEQKSKEMYYDGYTSTSENSPWSRYFGRAVINPLSARKYSDTNVSPIGPVPDSPPITDHSTHLIELGGQANRYAEYESLSLEEEGNMTDHHYFLMIPFIAGFGLDDKSWRSFYAGSLQHIEYRRIALKNLVLAEEDLNMIKALAHQQNTSKVAFKMDFISGKGEGQVVLLHGPPGVGKTYTVEAVSAYSNRPLLTLTIADIGTNEEDMESNLSKWLNLAEEWNAVLLIDEADVFLQRRGNSSIQRNGLVSVFLRKMEYFRGLLFLTTNRVGQIDDSFSSRIHAVIGYPRLDNDKRARIWNSFFTKLKTEHIDKIYVSENAKEYVLNNEEVHAREWNGREIRNAFQTAAALAEYEAYEDRENRVEGQKIEIRKEHFQQVMNMSKKFSNYMTKLDEKSESERGRARKDRVDDLVDDDMV